MTFRASTSPTWGTSTKGCCRCGCHSRTGPTATTADVSVTCRPSRLLLRRCVYGVDVSPMGAEIAKISLWLASFVPGLTLAYLDHNVRVGNSLIGVASAEQLLDADGGTTIPAMLVMEQMDRAA